ALKSGSTKPIHQAATELADVAKKMREPRRKKVVYSDKQVSEAFEAMIKYPSPPSPEKSQAGDEQTKLLKEAIDAIVNRKPESEIDAIVQQIKDETIQQDLAQAQKEAAAVRNLGKAHENVLETIDELVKQQAAAARRLLRACDDRAAGNGDKAVARHVDTLRKLIDRFLVDYKAARHNFTALRYENEARSNQR